MMINWKSCWFMSVLMMVPLTVSAAEMINQIQTRENVTLEYFIKSPENKSSNLLLFFPRGGGQGHFSAKESGGYKFSEEFLMRSLSNFVDQGVSVAVIGVPTDREEMDEAFRMSDEHYTDVVALVKELIKSGYKSVYFVANGSGTPSPLYLASRSLPPEVKGIALLSVQKLEGFSPLSLATVTLPTLILHHQNNGCLNYPYAKAAGLKAQLSPKAVVNFIKVTGGKETVADECGNYSLHQFNMVEKPVVDTIMNWVAGKKVPASIGAK